MAGRRNDIEAMTLGKEGDGESRKKKATKEIQTRK
jgi:hypothetical protein